MVATQQIREHMPVVSSDGTQFATVDHVEGNSIKLTKHDSPDGQHHWIPMDWVKSVDQHVHVDRPVDRARREWSMTPPGDTMMNQSQESRSSAQ
jgi:hypothetical protein